MRTRSYLLASLLLSCSLSAYASDEEKEGESQSSLSSSPSLNILSNIDKSQQETAFQIIEKEAEKENLIAIAIDEFLFDKPNETAIFGKIPEHGEWLSKEEKKEKACASTKELIDKKGRKNLSVEDEDIFVSLLHNEFPITYLTGLSIDGGGIRGLIPALLLEELSKRLSKPLYHYFDYIGGTSIGGILALGLTAPNLEGEGKPLLSPSDLVALFDRGGEIFPSEKVTRSYFNPLRLWDGLRYLTTEARATVVSRYDPQGLVSLLKEKLGKKAYLHQALTNTLVTSVDIEHSRPQTYLFDSRNATKFYSTEEASIPLWEVGRSTSAAPTYFPAYNLSIENKHGRFIEKHKLIDGGLWVNNPSVLVARSLFSWASEEFMFASPKNIVMLSLGTGYGEEGKRLPERAGLLTAAAPVIDTLMNVSSFGAHEAMQELLGKRNYLRVNPKLKGEIKLDETDPTELKILRKAAESKFEDIHTFIDGPFRRVLEADEFRTRYPVIEEVDQKEKEKESEVK